MPNRAPELTWEDEPTEQQAEGPRRAALVAAALALADEEGLQAVSIRRVAAKLGVRPMSLYTYIASKEDLLRLMVDAAVADVLVPEPLPDDWREALRQIARRSHETFRAHPWVLEAVSRSSLGSPNVARHAEQSRRAVAGLKLERDDAEIVLGVLDDYTIGHALRVITMERLEEGGTALPPAGRDFEPGLEAVLDGIEKRFVR